MEDYSKLFEKLSELGFSRFNSFNSSDGEIEFWTNIKLGSPYVASVDYYRDSNNKPYIRFSYISNCLGSTVKSMPLRGRNKDIDRFMREYEQFNDMITAIRNIGY
jgi:hypothetical protein